MGWSSSPEQEKKYSVIIDAGSSGSRAQIYTWFESQETSSNDDVLPRIERQADEGKIEPGLSSIPVEQKHVDKYFEGLVEFVDNAVPWKDRKNTPVYLLATAGMRLLPEDKRNKLLNMACRTWKEKSHFLIGDCSEHFRVISGKDEGLYGWVAMNYLMGGLGPIEGKPRLSDKRKDGMYGFLDMGGASTQIAFEPGELEKEQHLNDLVHITLQSRSGQQHEHWVFVATWLGFGSTQARERYVDALISEENAHLPIIDRIESNESKQGAYGHHHEGADLDQEEDIEFTGEPISRVIDDPCLHPGLYVTEVRYPGVTLHGTGDFKTCLSSLEPLLRKTKQCMDEPCLFDGTHVPPIHFESTPFVGVADYWHATNDLWSLGGAHDASRYESYAAAFCSQEWDIVANPDGQPHPDLPRLETQCFRAAWISNVLHEGIGIPRYHVDPESNVTPHFQSLSGIDQITLSWTLGRVALDVAAPRPLNSLASGSDKQGLNTPVIAPAQIPVTTTVVTVAAPLVTSEHSNKKLDWSSHERQYFADENLMNWNEASKRGSSYKFIMFLIILLALGGYLAWRLFKQTKMFKRNKTRITINTSSSLPMGGGNRSGKINKGAGSPLATTPDSPYISSPADDYPEPRKLYPMSNLKKNTAVPPPPPPPPPANGSSSSLSSLPAQSSSYDNMGPLPLPLEAQLPANPTSAMKPDRFIQGWNDMPDSVAKHYVSSRNSSSRGSRRALSRLHKDPSKKQL